MLPFQRFSGNQNPVDKPPHAMKKALSCLLICLLFACKTDDPQARLLVGRWEVFEYTYNNLVRKPDTTSAYRQQIEFVSDGSISVNNVIGGSYCSLANRYVYKQSKLYFDYGDFNCVNAFADPPPPEFATVDELSATSLTIKFGPVTYRLKRI